DAMREQAVERLGASEHSGYRLDEPACQQGERCSLVQERSGLRAAGSQNPPCRQEDREEEKLQEVGHAAPGSAGSPAQLPAKHVEVVPRIGEDEVKGRR